MLLDKKTSRLCLMQTQEPGRNTLSSLLPSQGCPFDPDKRSRIYIPDSIITVFMLYPFQEWRYVPSGQYLSPETNLFAVTGK